MIIIYILFSILTALIWWGYIGYFLFLHTKNNQSGFKIPDEPTRDYPAIAVLIPCLNEESIIQDKINNINKLKYPRDKLSVYFLDGGSSDDTLSIIQTASDKNLHIHAVDTHVKGKIAQLNYILPALRTDIIVNTDVDGILEENTLLKIVARFQADPGIGVVGTTVIPEKSPALEQSHWETQNWIRSLESSVYSSSVVVAVCYAFKRIILERFPQDVIADDVYITFISNLKGYKSVYAPEIVSKETRVPGDLSTIILHKFRKTHANIVETLRFFFCTFSANRFWCIIFYTRALQILFLPLLSIIYCGLMLFLLINNHYYACITGISFIMISFFFYNRLNIQNSRLMCGRSLLNTLAVFILLNLLLSFSLIAHPFLSQTSNYHRINS